MVSLLVCEWLWGAHVVIASGHVRTWCAAAAIDNMWECLHVVKSTIWGDGKRWRASMHKVYIVCKFVFAGETLVHNTYILQTTTATLLQ